MTITTPPEPTEDEAALNSTLADLIAESRTLRTDVHAAEAARRLASHVNLALLGLVGVLVALLLVVTWQGSQTNARIADCTTAGGKCYEDSRARTGAAIADLIRAETFVAECARLYPGEAGPAFDRKMEACVANRLAVTVQPSPSPAPSVTPSR